MALFVAGFWLPNTYAEPAPSAGPSGGGASNESRPPETGTERVDHGNAAGGTSSGTGDTGSSASGDTSSEEAGIPKPSSSGDSPLSNGQLEMMNQNGINYYNPEGGCFESAGGGVGGGGNDAAMTGKGAASLSAAQADFARKWHDFVVDLSIKYGIPWEVALAQGVHESTAGTSKMAKERRNFHGINAQTRHPERAYYYKTDNDGWIGYFWNLVHQGGYIKKGLCKGKAITDPYAALEAIAKNGYATDTDYIPKNTPLIKSMEKLAQAEGWKSSAELAKEHPEMLTNAEIIAKGNSKKNPYKRSGGGKKGNPFSFKFVGLKGGSTAQSTEGASDDSDSGEMVDVCATASGEGNGDINRTALELAWPEHAKHGCTPKPEYKEAMSKAGTTRGTGPGCDCAVFVETVVLYSGADPKFPKKKITTGVLEYLAGNKTDWQEIPNTGNTADLAPGDIMVIGHTNGRVGHVQIFVRREDGQTGIASASLNSRSGDFTTSVSFEAKGRGKYRIFRNKNSTSSEDSDYDMSDG